MDTINNIEQLVRYLKGNTILKKEHNIFDIFNPRYYPNETFKEFEKEILNLESIPKQSYESIINPPFENLQCKLINKKKIKIL